MSRIRFIVLIIVLFLFSLAQTTPSYGQTTPDSPSVSIRDFHLVSPTEGWVWTDHLYWTKDSGQTWTDITPPNLSGGTMAAVTFVDNQHGMVIITTVVNGLFSHTLTRT